MTLAIIKTLARQLDLSFKEETDINPDYFWQGATIKRPNGELLLVLINKVSRFIVVIPDILNQEDVLETIEKQIRETLKYCDLTDEEIEAYFNKSPNWEVCLPDQKIKTWLIKQTKEVSARLDAEEQKGMEIDYARLGAEVSILPERNSLNETGPIIPRLKMYNVVCGNKEEKDDEKEEMVYKIKSSLWGASIAVNRTFLISAEATFEELSNILRKLYGFSSGHLWAFEVFSTNRKYGPDITLRHPFEDEPTPPPPFMNKIFHKDFTLPKHVELNQLFPSFHHINFLYDFGDGWLISLNLKGAYKTFGSPANFLPYELSGEGPNPAEDMGGIYAYNALVYAKTHPKEIAGNDYLKGILEFMNSNRKDFDLDYKLELPQKI